jgi:tetratricopeptide (TPR) repeat protein
MLPADQGPASTSTARLERLRALLTLLPAAVLLWPGPGAPLRGDPLPDLSGAGWAALCAIPAAIAALLARKSALTRPAAALLAFLVVAGLSRLIGPSTDTQAASRALLLSLATLACFLAGSSLGAEGRRWLAGGSIALALLALVPAVAPGALSWAGALGNKASISEAALPGALAGAVLFCAPGLWPRLFGGLAALLFAVHAGRAPVLASGVALLIALALAWLLAGPRSRQAPQRLRMAAFSAVLAAACASKLVGGSQPVPPPAVVQQKTLPPSSDLRGLEVRRRIASSSLHMLAASPLLGVGPGQFAAAFPPFRDAREIELSSLNHNLPGQVTEVEHAHDDWLQGWLDAGLLGGFAWLAFLLLSGRRALLALRSVEPARAALGAGAIAILLAALARSPLLTNPGSACTAFAFLGAICTSWVDARKAGFAARGLALATVGLLIWQSQRAQALIEHGRALARAIEQPSQAAHEIERALAACPDSVAARSLQARFGARGPSPAPESVPASVALWHAVLELRPHHFEAWMESGNAWARAGELDAGRAAFERALALDPGDPALRANLGRLEVEAGRPEAALEHVRALEAAQRLPSGWLAGAAAEALRRVDARTARAMLAHLHPEWSELTAQQAWERSVELESSDPELARALRALANLEWAREHMASGAPETAVRSYRQAQQTLAWRPDPAGEVHLSAALSLELAAALLAAGRPVEAEKEVARAAAGPSDLARLPEWAAAALREGGLAGR